MPDLLIHQLKPSLLNNLSRPLLIRILTRSTYRRGNKVCSLFGDGGLEVGTSDAV